MDSPRALRGLGQQWIWSFCSLGATHMYRMGSVPGLRHPSCLYVRTQKKWKSSQRSNTVNGWAYDPSRTNLSLVHEYHWRTRHFWRVLGWLDLSA